MHNLWPTSRFESDANREKALIQFIQMFIIDTKAFSNNPASVSEGQLDDRMYDERDLLPRYTQNIWLLSISFPFSSVIGEKTRV